FVSSVPDDSAFYTGTVADDGSFGYGTIADSSGTKMIFDSAGHFDGYYTIFRDGSTTLPAGTVTLNRYFSVQTGQSYPVDPSQSGGSNGLGSETGVITINGVPGSVRDPPEAPIPTGSQPTWSMAALGDFNGEGGAGLAFQRSSDSLVAIQLFRGVTRVGGGDLGHGPFDMGWQVTASGDFN